MLLKKIRIFKNFSVFLAIFLTFFCSAIFFSCKKKSESKENIRKISEREIKKIKNFIFEDIKKLLKSEKNANENDEFFYLKKILSYRYFENGLSFYYFEKYFPEYLGAFESDNFYVPEFEAAAEIENLILKAVAEAEEERIADEISFLEEFANENPEIFDEKNILPEEDEFEKIINSEQSQKEITDKNGNLIFMEFEGERFIPQKTENGYFIIHSQNNQVTKKFYNFDFRLESVEKRSVKNSELKGEQNRDFLKKYFYDEETQNLTKTETFEAAQKTIFFYDENKNPTKTQIYKIQDEQTFLIFENNIKYDENGNVAENMSAEYFYNEDFSAQTDVFTKKYVYAQNREEIPPDFEYYEDDILKMKNKYSTEKGDYTSQIFFDDDLSVKIFYRNDEKTREIYFAGEKILWEKNYEN